MINKIILVGNLTRDVEVKIANNGMKVSNFTVACNRKDGCDFIPVAAFGKTAEIVANGKKGKMIGVDGRLKIETKEYKGERRTFTTVIADRVALIGGKNDEEHTENTTGLIQPENALYTPEELKDELPF